ncbi:hypothetical protein SAMN04490369_103911 [Vreelandella aquamarina]|uniref:Uncharacterized protein n=1 Tax=Vreelandella aquamarina TaxID=77097 RepID=A0A1H8LCK4_9GAMM|nr:hypothetical protein SAMN04490369_103911 [Halomonas aquamarina]
MKTSTIPKSISRIDDHSLRCRATLELTMPHCADARHIAGQNTLHNIVVGEVDK